MTLVSTYAIIKIQSLACRQPWGWPYEENQSAPLFKRGVSFTHSSQNKAGIIKLTNKSTATSVVAFLLLAHPNCKFYFFYLYFVFYCNHTCLSFFVFFPSFHRGGISVTRVNLLLSVKIVQRLNKLFFNF